MRDGKVQIVDEYTGRVMPDRSWERGLHQMIEVKEGCELTGQRETLARITYQRFFRRYLRLAGMTGTAREVARRAAGGLRAAGRCASRPTGRCAQRRRARPCTRRGRDKWEAVVERQRGAARAAGRCWSARARSRPPSSSERCSRRAASRTAC